jgi:hypothetical protein
MLQLAPRGEIAVPMFELEDLYRSDVKAGRLRPGVLASVASRDQHLPPSFDPNSRPKRRPKTQIPRNS